MKYSVLKVDLVKVYDRVDWSCLCLNLFHIGFPFEVMSWIMGCISTTSFATMVNGTLTPPFRSSRGLRKGFRLSPLLFLLIIDGLSTMINERKMERKSKFWNYLLLSLFPICFLCMIFSPLGMDLRKNWCSIKSFFTYSMRRMVWLLVIRNPIFPIHVMMKICVISFNRFFLVLCLL